MKIKRTTNILISLVLCVACYSSIYISRSTLSSLASLLNDSGILNTAQYGIVGSAFFITFAICRVYNGYLSDKFPSWLLISLGVILAGSVNIAIGLYTNPTMILVCWIINAIGQSMLWSAILVAVVNPAGSDKKATYVSILGSTVGLGNMLGIILTLRSSRISGIKSGFIIPGCFVILVGIVTLLFFRTEERTDKITQSPLSVLKNRSLLSLVLPLMVNGMLKDGIPLWLVTYVITDFGLDISKVSGYVFFVPLVGTLGRLLFSTFYRIVGKNEFRTGLYTYLISAVLMVPLCMNVKNTIIPIVCLSLVLGLSSIANLALVGMYPTRYEKTNQTGLVSGGVDFLIYMGSGISSLFFGYIINGFGFRIMFAIWIILMIFSCIFLYRSMKKE